MSDIEHARAMLAMARKDLRALRAMLDPEIFDHGVFGFHAQQAVEKAAKAWLSLLGLQYPRTHDLEELMVLLESRGILLGQETRSLAGLTDFAVQFRYESFEDLGAEIDRPDVLRRVIAFVEQVEAAVRDSSGA